MREPRCLQRLESTKIDAIVTHSLQSCSAARNEIRYENFQTLSEQRRKTLQDTGFVETESASYFIASYNHEDALSKGFSEIKILTASLAQESQMASPFAESRCVGISNSKGRVQLIFLYDLMSIILCSVQESLIAKLKVHFQSK